ncbi:NmrA family NAD(P)-binding protein [Defluviitalea phaphyphila]|uniref:NmrA family NAD(P)-binding protein n=1 Tax=Defluviitalea phaphyphila TaxID=1473580 RepID=UPI000731916C|nr:NmrA family NAD(P)-binding protein [Defluviitalea phaphyphila]
MTDKKHVAVIGSRGQVGTPLTKELLNQGHKVTMIARSQKTKLDPTIKEFIQLGANLSICDNMKDVKALSKAFEGCDVVVCCVPGSKEIILEFEPIWLEAAVLAGVKRFVPTEFGAHTKNLNYGAGEIFDNKKVFHEKLFKSDIGWTLFYNGGFFDYFLPNLRYFDEITTFGQMDLPIYTHDINDVGTIAARAITDDRTLNKCVQMDYNVLSQKDMLNLLHKYWPNAPFVYKHYSSAYIKYMKNNNGNEITAKKGAETDKERWGINYVIYVLGQLVAFTEDTLKASELWPDFICKNPEDALKDPKFVFEKEINF